GRDRSGRGGGRGVSLPSGCVLWLGDCREVLPGVAPGSVDLVFADPPFNIGEPYLDHVDRIRPFEYKVFTRGWIAACVGALRAGGSMWVNIPDEHVCHVHKVLDD